MKTGFSGEERKARLTETMFHPISQARCSSYTRTAEPQLLIMVPNDDKVVT
jgi:hypothetical protein